MHITEPILHRKIGTHKLYHLTVAPNFDVRSKNCDMFFYK